MDDWQGTLIAVSLCIFLWIASGLLVVMGVLACTGRLN